MPTETHLTDITLLHERQTEFRLDWQDLTYASIAEDANVNRTLDPLIGFVQALSGKMPYACSLPVVGTTLNSAQSTRARRNGFGACTFPYASVRLQNEIENEIRVP